MGKMEIKPKMICHGGAGKKRSYWRESQAAVKRAADEGYKVLKKAAARSTR